MFSTEKKPAWHFRAMTFCLFPEAKARKMLFVPSKRYPKERYAIWRCLETLISGDRNERLRISLSRKSDGTLPNSPSVPRSGRQSTEYGIAFMETAASPGYDNLQTTGTFCSVKKKTLLSFALGAFLASCTPPLSLSIPPPRSLPPYAPLHTHSLPPLSSLSLLLHHLFDPTSCSPSSLLAFMFTVSPRLSPGGSEQWYQLGADTDLPGQDLPRDAR